VATLISPMTNTSRRCRPILSPRIPQTIAPSGLMKKEMA
jgi:hypothetical protein